MRAYYETFIKALEEKKADEMEMAKETPQERKAKEKGAKSQKQVKVNNILLKPHNIYKLGGE